MQDRLIHRVGRPLAGVLQAGGHGRGSTTSHGGRGCPPAVRPAHPLTARARGEERRRRVKAELADDQDGVVSVGQLRGMGLTYDEVRAEVEAGRWRRVGRRTISTLGDAPLSERALWHRAIWEVGGGARLDGVTALKAWGLTKWDEDVVHVSVPRGARHRKVPGVRVHVLRELEIGEG